MVEQRLTISQLAGAAGIPTSTIRYYERIGLVVPEDRTGGNYRLYGRESLRKLKFIRSAQAVGFTLEDIQSLLGHADGGPVCGDVQALIEARLADIDRRLRDLRHVQRVLKEALRQCRESHPRAACRVVKELKEQE